MFRILEAHMKILYGGHLQNKKMKKPFIFIFFQKPGRATYIIFYLALYGPLMNLYFISFDVQFKCYASAQKRVTCNVTSDILKGGARGDEEGHSKHFGKKYNRPRFILKM